ncbi:all-trans retinoic acid-induced differentiation factor-like [Acropora palmata]|uniref:all-trans retinoic acid-induced differentiation factor-like n=1 Tax=Acropora palmata TaxID=6131 RepID=UPI003DA12AD7
MAVTCPSNSHCLPNGPGLTECLCNTRWFGYKCLVKHGFPWALIFASIVGATAFLIAVVMFHQRKRGKGKCFKSQSMELTKVLKEFTIILYFCQCKTAVVMELVYLATLRY